MNRKVGQMAETWAKHLAESAGIVVNQAHTDERGWDLLFELPTLGFQDDSLPLDRQGGRMVCRVQVKGGDNIVKAPRANGTIGDISSVKLSNWVELVRFHGPAFYLVLDYAGGEAPAHGFLVHVGEDWAGKTLRRLRKIELKDRLTKLHKKYQSLTWRAEHELTPLSGSALIDRIEAFVGHSSRDYVEKKMEMIARVGYRAGERYLVQISAGASERTKLSDNKLAEIGVNLRDSLNVDTVRLLDNRFELPLMHDEALGDTVVRFPGGSPDLGPIWVEMHGPQSGLCVRMQCSLYDSVSLFPALPAEVRMMRLVSDAVDITLTKKLANVKISTPRSLTVQSAAEFGQLIELLDAEIGNHIRVVGETPQGPKDLPSFVAPPLDSKLRESVSPTRDALRVARRLQISSQTPVSVGRLVVQAKTLDLLAKIFEYERDTTDIDIVIEPLTEEEPIGFVAGCVFASIVRIADDLVAFGVGILHGPTQQTDTGGWKLRPLSFKLIDAGVLGDDDHQAYQAARVTARAWMNQQGVLNFLPETEDEPNSL